MTDISFVKRDLEAIKNQIVSRFVDYENIGVLSGLSGNAIFLFHYANFFNDSTVAVKAKELIERSIDYLNKGYINPSYCYGICGFAWALDYLNQNNFLDIDTDEYLLQLDSYLYNTMIEDFSKKNYDYLHNALGYAFYFIKRYNNTEVESVKIQYRQTIIETIDLLDNIAIKTNNGDVIWESYMTSLDEHVIDLGLAHGIPSILIFYVELYKMDEFRNLVKDNMLKTLKFILNCKTVDTNSLSLFPTYLYKDKDSADGSKSRLAWCYGDLGIAVAIWKTGVALNDESLKEQAIEIFKYNASRKSGINDMYICHGSFGVSQIYANIYRETDFQEFKECSEYWFKDGIQKFNELSVNLEKQKLSLIEGLSGVGLVLISHLTHEKLFWDESILLS